MKRYNRNITIEKQLPFYKMSFTTSLSLAVIKAIQHFCFSCTKVDCWQFWKWN